MEKDTKLVNHLLLDAADSSEALASLNRLQKSRSDRWSMQFACRKIGIPSTGYFSDVLKGKRRLHPKYLPGTRAAFGLSMLQGNYFTALVLRDQDADDESKRLQREEELSKLADQLRIEFINIPKQLSDGLLWHILVLSSFSLFQASPTLSDLETFFGRGLAIPLGKSLHKLRDLGLIEIHGSHYSLTKTQIIFNESEDGFSHLEFLEKSIIHAASQVKSWFPKADQSFFLSTVVTVKMAEFEAKLPDISARIYAMLNDLNSVQGDQLVEFNVQLFPFDSSVFQL